MYELNTTNKKLASHIKAIQRLDATTKKSIFETAVRLNIINTEGWAKEEGYKNTAELALEVFGYSRSTVLNYIKIAERYLVVNNLENNKMEISTICARRDEKGKVVTDYNIGQLNAIGKLSQVDFIQLDKEDVISPYMSQSELKKAVKNWEKQFLDEEEVEQEQEQEQNQGQVQDNENVSHETPVEQPETSIACIERIKNDLKKLEHLNLNKDEALNIIVTIEMYVDRLISEV